MAEFTLPPGPWETDPHGTGEHGSVYDALGEQVLQTQPKDLLAGKPGEQVAYRKELARRLTAYPDLYEALKDCVQALSHTEAGPRIDAARAALAKAEGQS